MPTKDFCPEISFARVQKALEAVRQGRGVLITDDADRENEGELVFAAQTLDDNLSRNAQRGCFPCRPGTTRLK